MFDDIGNLPVSFKIYRGSSLPVQNEGKGDGAIGDEAAEIFAEGWVAEDILAGLGGDDKKAVKKQDANQGIGNTCPENRGATRQNGGAGENIAVEMGGINVQHTDILNVDDVAATGDKG